MIKNNPTERVVELCLNETIRKELHQIRTILEGFEQSDFNSLTSFYHSPGFPIGCCGDAANLVGLYLFKYHGLACEYVCGKGLDDDPEQSHAWILCQGHIIDITADQFKDRQLAPVIIEVQSTFHDSFYDYRRRSIGIGQSKHNKIPAVLKKVVSIMNRADDSTN